MAAPDVDTLLISILANLASGLLGRPLIPFLNELLIGLD